MSIIRPDLDDPTPPSEELRWVATQNRVRIANIDDEISEACIKIENLRAKRNQLRKQAEDYEMAAGILDRTSK